MKIIVKNGETLDSALRRWKKDVSNSGVLDKCREKEAHMSTSDRRKYKESLNRKRQNKQRRK